MSAHFISSYPSWLNQPSILFNVLHNSFAPLKDVPSALSLSDSSSFMAGLRQALYWRRRLATSASSHTVIFTFLGVGGLTSPNVSEVCRALRSIANISKPTEIYRALNSPFIGISFLDSSSVTLFQTLCSSYNDHLVIHVTPAVPDTYTFKLIGLPPLFPDHRVHHFISKHTESHSFSREIISIDEHTNIPLNSITGSLKLKPGQLVTHLPHLIPLPSPHSGSAMLIIQGRQSLCLKCGGMGHVRRLCSSFRCSTCSRFHSPSTSCSDSALTVDPSFLHDWQPDVSLTPSSLHDSISLPFSLPECDHTHKSSPPTSSSSTATTPSFADIVSTAVKKISPATSFSHDTITSVNLNLTMPSNLPSGPDTFLHSVSPNSHNELHHTLPDFPELDHHQHISTLPSALIKDHSMSFTSPVDTTCCTIVPPISSTAQLCDNVDSMLPAAKKVKKVSLAHKRNHTSSSSSSSSNNHHRSSHKQANHDIPITAEPSLTHIVLAPSTAISMSTTTVTDAMPSTASSPSLPPTYSDVSLPIVSAQASSSHKKSRRSSTKKSNISLQSTSNHPSLSSEVSSWGKRMDELSEPPNHPTVISPSPASNDIKSLVSTATLDFIQPQLSTSQILDTASSLLSTSTTANNTIIPSASSLISESHTINDDFHDSVDMNISTPSGVMLEELDSDFTVVSIRGFPADTHTCNLQDFAGYPPPYYIFCELDQGKVFRGHLFMYHKEEHLDLVLSKDGSWSGDHIISVSIQHLSDDSE